MDEEEEGAGRGGRSDIHSGLLRVYSGFKFLGLKISAPFGYLKFLDRIFAGSVWKIVLP